MITEIIICGVAFLGNFTASIELSLPLDDCVMWTNTHHFVQLQFSSPFLQSPCRNWITTGNVFHIIDTRKPNVSRVFEDQDHALCKHLYMHTHYTALVANQQANVPHCMHFTYAIQVFVSYTAVSHLYADLFENFFYKVHVLCCSSQVSNRTTYSLVFVTGVK